MSIKLKSNCKSCGSPILWGRTAKGRNMPLDVMRSEGGNVELLDGIATIVTPDHRERYRSHFTTCPNASDHRRPR